jgi:hypothetical protein
LLSRRRMRPHLIYAVTRISDLAQALADCCIAAGRHGRRQLGVNTYLVAPGDFLHAFDSGPQGARAGRPQAGIGEGEALGPPKQPAHRPPSLLKIRDGRPNDHARWIGRRIDQSFARIQGETVEVVTIARADAGNPVFEVRYADGRTSL